MWWWIDKSVLYFSFYRIRHKCSECLREFGRKDTLKRHQDTTHGKSDHLCPECQQSFGRIDALKRHQQEKHLGVRYSCEFCDKEFTRKQTLNAHAKCCREKANLPAEDESANDWVLLPTDRKGDEEVANQWGTDAVHADGFDQENTQDKMDGDHIPLSAVNGEDNLLRHSGNQTPQLAEKTVVRGKENVAAAPKMAMRAEWSVRYETEKKNFVNPSIALTSGAVLRNKDQNMKETVKTVDTKQLKAIGENHNDVQLDAAVPDDSVKMVRFCTECGAKFTDDADKCCGNCGTRRKLLTH